MAVSKWGVLPLLIVLLVLTAGCPAPVVEPDPAVVEPEPRVVEPEPAVVEPDPEEPVEEIIAAFPPIKGGLKLELSLPRTSYQRGEILSATLSLINTTAEPISLSTRTSQLFDLVIEGTERVLRWSEDKVFLTVITPHRIPAGERLSDVLSLKINLAPGDVYLTGVTVPLELNGEQIRLRTIPLKIVVQPEPAAVEPDPEEPVEEITTAFSEIKGGLKLELSLPRTSYQRGEILRARLSLINTTPEPISFSTRTSQSFDLILQGQGLFRRWSEDKMFLQVITPHRILAGERLSDVLSLEIDLKPGEYDLIAVTVDIELNGELIGEQIRLKTAPLRITVE